MKPRTDFHMHSTFSPDAENTIQEMSRRAYEQGLDAIAFTEHAEWQQRGEGFPYPDAYFAAIRTARRMFAPRGLTIYAGVELGNPHDFVLEVEALLSSYSFDIVIGSVHWLHGVNIHSRRVFQLGEPETVFRDYFIEVGLLSAGFDVDIIAHFDRILRTACEAGIEFHPWLYEDVIRGAFEQIARRGQTLELNSCYLHRHADWRRALRTMLSWYREEGGARIMVNSDAHSVAGIAANFNLAREILESSGLEPATPLHRSRVSYAAL